MNEQFDPYYTWLGIPPSEHPPNLYRLLGIQEFEVNAKVIDNAADRQMMHLRSFQNGPNSAESQRLLNEVAAARICLHDPSQKAVYDDDLRHRRAAAHPPLASVQVAPSPSSPTIAVALRGDGARRAKGTKSKNAIIEIVKIVVGGLAGVLVAVLVLQYVVGLDLLGWNAKAEKEIAKAPNSAPVGQSPTTTESKPTLQPATPAPVATSPSPALPSPTPTSPPAPALPSPTSASPPASPAAVSPRPEKPPSPMVSPGPTENPVAVAESSTHASDALIGRFDIRYSNATRRDYLFEKGGVVKFVGQIARDDTSPIPPLSKPLESRVFWHPVGNGAVGYVYWTQGAKVERISIGDKLVRFTLFPTEGSVTGFARKIGPPSTPTVATPTVGTTELAKIVGRFDILYSNKTRRDYVFEGGGVVRFQGATNPGYSGPIPPLDKPLRSVVQWHVENGRTVGNIFWPDGPKVERIVLENDGRMQFTLYSNETYVVGEVRGLNPASLVPINSIIPKDRAPVPDEADLVAARAKLKAIFGDTTKSTNPQEKLKLSGELRGVADSEKDPVIRYALLDAARRLAMGAQDVQAALLVVEEIVNQYETDQLSEQLKTLKLASGTLMPPAAWETAADAAVVLANRSLLSRREDIAESASLLAVDFAAKGKKLEWRKQAKQTRDEVLAYQKMSALMKEAEETLKTVPDDSAANLVLAKWQCFVLNDLEGSLPFWEKCGDLVLAKAANTQRDEKANGLEKGDAWLAAAERFSGEERIAAQRIAKARFAEAARDLKGLDKLVAARREAELASIEQAPPQAQEKVEVPTPSR